jgi:ubiquitin thioesterase ZRANB1
MDYNQNELENNTANNLDNTTTTKKWRCELCTYENWPSATKCTICQTIINQVQNKPPEDPPPPSSLSQQTNKKTNIDDIYKLATLKITPKPIDTQQQQQTIEKFKWNCSQCTYLNWPKSKHCIQCNTLKTQTPHTSPIQSPLNSPSTIKKSTEILKKWQCKQCTYQNWPKAQRCIMCTTLRNPTTTTPTISQPTNNIPTLNDTDRLFLAACKGIYESDLSFLSSYITSGADLARYLSQDECKLLNTTISNNVFHVGLTLIHLCYQYKHKDELMKLLNRNSKVKKQLLQKHYQQQQQQQRYPSPTSIYKIKFSPCQSCPLLATNIIERYITSNIRQRRFDSIGSCILQSSTAADNAISLPSSLCYYINDCHTFILPTEIEHEFVSRIQKVLFNNLFDYEVQYELEIENKAVNWCQDVVKRLNSKLYALWNRHSGDCLLDSVLQGCYGVFDKDNTLRQLMYECLEVNSVYLKSRWKEHELLMAKTNQLNYTIDDIQLEQDWQNILQLANTPGSSLEQAHIFALCHILRRPIIIYSIKYVKNNRSENIGLTYFEGVYLPLLWESSFCFKNPITLGYTRGHFTALVPIEKNVVGDGDVASGGGGCVASGGGGGGGSENTACGVNMCLCSGGAIAGAIGGACCTCGVGGSDVEQVFYLPLTNHEGHLLPVHFLTANEVKFFFFL